MARKERHSKAEIAAKLAQADELATQGKLKSEIARTLGVSVMTLHRWHKISLAPHAPPMGGNEPGRLDQRSQSSRNAELQLENLRLRRVVIDLLLEKTRLEEAFQVNKHSR